MTKIIYFVIVLICLIFTIGCTDTHEKNTANQTPQLNDSINLSKIEVIGKYQIVTPIKWPKPYYSYYKWDPIPVDVTLNVINNNPVEVKGLKIQVQFLGNFNLKYVYKNLDFFYSEIIPIQIDDTFIGNLESGQLKEVTQTVFLNQPKIDESKYIEEYRSINHFNKNSPGWLKDINLISINMEILNKTTIN